MRTHLAELAERLGRDDGLVLVACSGGADSLALAEAVDRGWPGLVSDQREVLDAYWADADIEVDGDPDNQREGGHGEDHPDRGRAALVACLVRKVGVAHGHRPR